MTAADSVDPPVVSVVLAVRDGAAFLDDAIDSVRTQTLNALELVVVDDGSSDESGDIARRHAKDDPRVIVLRTEGVGLAAALNVGVDAARGEWIGRLDADDIALPERFALQVDAARDQPDVAAWAGWAEAISVDGRRLSAMHQGPRTARAFRRQHARGTLRPIHTTVIIRREVLKALGGYDPTVVRAQDIELWDRFGEHHVMLTVPQVVTLVRVHQDSATSRQMDETLLTHHFVAARRRARRRGQDLDMATFRAQLAEQSWLRGLPGRCSRYARHAHRAAGIAYADGRWLHALGRTLLAWCAAPTVITPKLWRQVARRGAGRAIQATAVSESGAADRGKRL